MTTTPNEVVPTKPRDVPSTTVPMDYAALGVKTGYEPRKAEDMRFFVTGPCGKGKTTWVASIPDALVLDFELGADAIPGAKAARVRVGSYEHYESLIKKLAEDGLAGKRKFRRVIWDTGDEWVNLLGAQLATEHGVPDIGEYGSKGAGWRLLCTRCWQGIQALHAAGYAWTVVGHLKEKTITHPGTHQEMTVLRPDIFPTLTGRILANADFYATVWMESLEEQEMVNVKLPDGRIAPVPKKGGLKVTETYWFDVRSAGGREGKARGVPNIEQRIALPRVGGWDVFVAKYNEAVERIKKGDI